MNAWGAADQVYHSTRGKHQVQVFADRLDACYYGAEDTYLPR